MAERLDKVVVEKAPLWVSRTFVQRQIKNSKVFVNSRPRNHPIRLRSESQSLLTFLKTKVASVEPEAILLKIVL